MARALFYGPDLKIKRADQLLIQLRQIEAAFFQENRPELIVEADPQTGNKLAKVVLKAEATEETYYLVGEIIYHLRSSLDQIAVALARVSVSKPNVRKIYFPSGDNIKGLVASRKANTKGIDTDLVKLMLRLKPYDGKRGNEALRSIFRLANIDKHLEIIPAANSGQIQGISNFIIQNANTGLLIGGGLISLYEGITISDLGQNGTIRPRNTNAQIQVSGQITFGNVSIYEGVPIVGKLHELVSLMQGILQMFTTYCGDTNRG
jgi:hypothetical protein